MFFCGTSTPAFVIHSRAKEELVLISADGPDANVLKIKPPMCFTKKDVDLVCSVLDLVIGEVEASQ